MKYLFESGRIENCQIRNKVVMPPMTTGFAGLDGQPTDQMVAFYEERAKGGVGLIVTEIFCIDPVSLNEPVIRRIRIRPVRITWVQPGTVMLLR